MHKTKIIFLVISASILSMIISGCVSRDSCAHNASKYGYYCYKNHNYGKKRTTMYKAGVKAGCRTAEGYYTKDYASSGWSSDYNQGWSDGRATCKHIIPSSARVNGMRTEYQQSLDIDKYRRGDAHISHDYIDDL